MKCRPSGPHSVPDFWLWESVLNPTASGKPIFGWAAGEALLPIPQMCCWNFGPARLELGLSSPDLCSCQGGCDGTVTALCTAFWQWPWDQPAHHSCPALLPLLQCQVAKRGRGGHGSRSSLSQCLAGASCGASCPTAYHPLGVGAVQVCVGRWWFVLPLAQVPIPRKWVVPSDRESGAQTGPTWGLAWQVCGYRCSVTVDLGRQKSQRCPFVPKIWVRIFLLVGEKFYLEMKVIRNAQSKRENPFSLATQSGKCILKTPPSLFVLILSFSFSVPLLLFFNLPLSLDIYWQKSNCCVSGQSACCKEVWFPRNETRSPTAEPTLSSHNLPALNIANI